MAFSDYVYKFREPKSYSLGPTIRAIVDQNQAQQRINNQDRQFGEQLGEQKAGRQDVNTRFSAEHAANQSANAYQQLHDKYVQGVKLTDQARAAVAAGDWNTADALAGRITELGGKVNKTMGPNGRPVYTFQAPQEPGREPIDYGGTRQQIFGGERVPMHGGDPGSIGQPFQMRGNAPGERNPYDLLPGASAAAMPQQAAPAAPPPQPQPAPGAPAAAPPAPDSGAPPAGTLDANQLPDAAAPSPAPGAAAAPPLPNAPQLQLDQPQVGANPFDPFKLDTNELINQNDVRIRPYLESLQAGVPERFKSRLDGFVNRASSIGTNPEDTLKLTNPAFSTLAGLMKGEMSAEAAAASSSLRGQGMEFTQSQRLREFAGKKIQAVRDQYNTKNEYKRFVKLSEIESLIDSAGKGNGNAAVAAITEIRNLSASGVMTDQDFTMARQGIKTIWSQIKDGTINALLKDGLSMDQERDLRDLLQISANSSKQNLIDARDAMLSRVNNDRTIADEERQEIITAAADMTPKALWTPQMYEWMGMPLPQKRGPLDQSGNYPVAPPQGGSSSSSRKASASRQAPVEQLTPGQAKQEVDDMLAPK